MEIDKDRIAADGLFYCVPWMREAQTRIEHRENLIRELEAQLAAEQESNDYLMAHYEQDKVDKARAEELLRRVDGGSNYRLYRNPEDAPRILRDIHDFLHDFASDRGADHG
jgi:hypothetical protein